VEHQYRELPPPPELTGYVQCFWTETTGDRPGEPDLRVLPDGCVDVVWRAGSPPVVVGPATHQIFPKIPPGATLVGARFHSGMAPIALHVPASELLNAEARLTDLWGRADVPPLGRFDDSRAPADGLGTLRALVRGRLARGATGDGLVRAAAQWLMGHPAGRLDALYDLAALSERQLRRRFEAAVGYGPKTFQRIVRFRTWLRLAERTPAEQRSLAELAAEAGYADQAHLTREVTRLAGLSPTVLLATMEAPPPSSHL
jgi:AraC-like DNA-binding protein